MANKKSSRSKFTVKKRHKPGAATYSKPKQSSADESNTPNESEESAQHADIISDESHSHNSLPSNTALHQTLDSNPDQNFCKAPQELSKNTLNESEESTVANGSSVYHADSDRSLTFNSLSSNSALHQTCDSNTDHSYFKAPEEPSKVNSMDQLPPNNDVDHPSPDSPKAEAEFIPPKNLLVCLLEAKRKIEMFLVPRIHAVVHLNCLHVLFLSAHNNLSIQRSVVFAPNGSVQLFVHRKELKVDPYLPQNCQPVLLCSDSIDFFVDRAVSIINRVREMEICSGEDNLDFRPAWSTCPGGKIDENPYDESRYVETFRSLSCDVLVAHNKWKCSSCAQLRRPLKRRAQFYAVQEPHPNTNNHIMSEDQKLQKMANLQKELTNERKRNAYLREKMQELIEKEGVTLDYDTSKDLTDILNNADLPEAQTVFLQQQVKASQHTTGMRWHPTMIRLALALHLTSPAALELLRQSGMIRLPCSRTLFDYSHVKPVHDGIDEVVLESLTKRVNEAPKHRRYHVLMMDEMSISQNLVIEKSTGRMIGYTKLNDLDKEIAALNQFLDNPDIKQEEKTASKILVFMVKGVALGTKEVVATFPTDNPSTHQMYMWTWQIIGALERSGIFVIALVCDGFSTNRAFIRLHKPVTVHPNGLIFETINKAAPHRKLYFISDVPHLLKTLRNCFMNSRWDGKKSRRRMMYKGLKITWDFLVRLYEEDKKKSLRKSFKLSAMNVYPDSYGRMKMKYAAEAVSATVAQNVEDKKWEGTSGTVEFIRIFNDWFDCLNGAHSSVGKKKRNPNLNPYTADCLGENPKDKRFEFLDSVLEYLRSWKEEAYNVDSNASFNVSNTADAARNIDNDDSEIFQGEDDDTPAHRRILSRETLEGIGMSTLAIKGAIEFLLNEGVTFINPRIFTQDPLEQHFSKVRDGQGGSTNPNYYQTLNRNRAIHTIGQLGVKKRKGNSGECDSTMEVTTEKLPKRKCVRGAGAKFDMS